VATGVVTRYTFQTIEAGVRRSIAKCQDLSSKNGQLGT